MYLLLFVLCLVAVYVITNQKSKSLTYSLGLLAIVLIVCANTHKNIEAFTDLAYAPTANYKMGPMDGLVIDSKYNINNNHVSTYDGLKLNIKETNKKDHQLLPYVKITSPVGDEIKLSSDPVSYSFPTVDGTPNTPKKLFMFSHNKSSLACCPSTFSDDRGCVCTTPEQQKLIWGRGGNKTVAAYHDI
jgi:hypothetical protein